MRNNFNLGPATDTSGIFMVDGQKVKQPTPSDRTYKSKVQKNRPIAAQIKCDVEKDDA